MKILIRYGGQQYELADVDWSLAELALVQRHTGLLATEFDAGLRNPQGNALALAAVLWLAVRRSGEPVKWADFEARLTAPLSTVEVELLDDTKQDKAPKKA